MFARRNLDGIASRPEGDTHGTRTDRDSSVLRPGRQYNPNRTHMVTTYRNTELQRNNANIIRLLNRDLSSMRYGVERTSGMIKGRCRLLLTPLTTASHSIERAVDLIVSIIVLHNFLISFDGKYNVKDPVMSSLLQEYKHQYRPVAQNRKIADSADAPHSDSKSTSKIIRATSCTVS